MSTFVRNTGVNEVKVVRVVEVRSLGGNGTEAHPYREVVEYYSFDGELLARHDPTRPDKDLGEQSTGGES